VGDALQFPQPLLKRSLLSEHCLVEAVFDRGVALVVGLGVLVEGDGVDGFWFALGG
jgi:hypothetical protein